MFLGSFYYGLAKSGSLELDLVTKVDLSQRVKALPPRLSGIEAVAVAVEAVVVEAVAVREFAGNALKT